MKWVERRRTSISRRILCIAMVCFVIPSVLLAGLFRRSLVASMDEDLELMAMDTVVRVAEQVEYRIGLYEMLMEGITKNEGLVQRLNRFHASSMENWETVRYIEQAFSYVYGELPGINGFRIYHDNASLVQDGSCLWKPGARRLAGESEEYWLNRLCRQSRYEWYVYPNPNTPSEMLTLVGTGVKTADVNSAVVLTLSMQRAFNDVLEATDYGVSSYVILDGEDRVLVSDEAAMRGRMLLETSYAPYLSMLEGSGVTAQKERGVCIASCPLRNGWRIIGAIELTRLGVNVNRLAVQQSLFAGAITAIGLAAILAISRDLSRRIRRLDDRLATMARGVLNVSIPVTGKDEFAAVESRFNRMVQRINELVREVETQKTREMEEAVRAMESYVNPHFLYNTLGLIRWRAVDNGDESLCDLVDDMTTYYRLSLSGGHSVVPVEDEMSHLEAYISIQQRRYSDSVNVSCQMDGDVGMAYTPKNILQTIVENCYVHGIAPGSGRSEIRVRAFREGKSVCFEVEDNGLGIPPDKLARIHSDDPKINPGIGIRSVRQRLRLYFGEDMEMTIHSQEGHGTVVRIVIPLCLEEPAILGGNG